MTLVEDCYRFSGEFPREELYGLTSQIRRAALSVPANIAESYGRNSPGSYIGFLRNAQGSLKELETHLTLAQRLKFGSYDKTAQLLALCESIRRMLVGLVRGIRNSEADMNRLYQSRAYCLLPISYCPRALLRETGA
jgi:four helix bundle protein